MKNQINLKNLYIAEIGTNHNGDFRKALNLVRLLINTKFNAIKFQIYEHYEILNKSITTEEYNMHDLYKEKYMWRVFDKKLKTPKKWMLPLKEICKKNNKFFGFTIHGHNGLKFAQKIQPDFIKIASMDHNNFPFIKDLINNVRCPIIVSLGMANEEDIETLFKILKKHQFGSGLMHCTSLYPPKKKELRLKNILYLKNKFKLPIGFSDHTIGINAAIIAKKHGATFFEKHVTDNNSSRGPDHSFALNIFDCNKYYEKVNQIKLQKKLKALKKFIKCTPREIKIRKVYLKSLITKREIQANTFLRKEDLLLQRPGKGIEPKFLDLILKKKTKLKLKKDKLIKWSDLKN